MHKPDLFKASKIEWQDRARAVARQLLRNREAITIEDVTLLCPRPRYLSPNVAGGVFQHSDFQVVGYTLATRPSSNKRLIRKWGLKNPEPRRGWYGTERDSD